jgi:hypothetical protein
MAINQEPISRQEKSWNKIWGAITGEKMPDYLPSVKDVCDTITDGRRTLSPCGNWSCIALPDDVESRWHPAYTSGVNHMEYEIKRRGFLARYLTELCIETGWEDAVTLADVAEYKGVIYSLMSASDISREHAAIRAFGLDQGE